MHMAGSDPGRTIRKEMCRRAQGMALLVLMVVGSGPAANSAPGRQRPTMSGLWAANGTPCRSPEEFLWLYHGRVARFPHVGADEPARACRVMERRGRYPEWHLRLSCQHPEAAFALPAPFEVRQVLRQHAGGQRMTAEVEPVLGLPARTYDLLFCRNTGDPEPMPR